MNWFWLNILVGVVFFLAMAGISLCMAIKHRYYRPALTDATGEGTIAQAGTVTVTGMTDRTIIAAQICDRRDLAGASAGDRG